MPPRPSSKAVVVRNVVAAVFVALVALWAPAPTWGADEASARQAAEKIVAALTAAFRSRDGEAFAAQFWPDGEFMNVFGQVVTGQEQIAAMTTRVFTGALKDRVVHMEIRNVRELAPNVILIDTTDSDAANPGGVKTRMKLVVEKRGDSWRVVAAQNTRVSTPAFETGVPR
jgi:uncharacterized protein (TIGR02246 family)